MLRMSATLLNEYGFVWYGIGWMPLWFIKTNVSATAKCNRHVFCLILMFLESALTLRMQSWCQPDLSVYECLVADGAENMSTVSCLERRVTDISGERNRPVHL